MAAAEDNRKEEEKDNKALAVVVTSLPVVHTIGSVDKATEKASDMEKTMFQEAHLFDSKTLEEVVHTNMDNKEKVDMERQRMLTTMCFS